MRARVGAACCADDRAVAELVEGKGLRRRWSVMVVRDAGGGETADVAAVAVVRGRGAGAGVGAVSATGSTSGTRAGTGTRTGVKRMDDVAVIIAVVGVSPGTGVAGAGTQSTMNGVGAGACCRRSINTSSPPITEPCNRTEKTSGRAAKADIVVVFVRSKPPARRADKSSPIDYKKHLAANEAAGALFQ